MRNAIGLAGCAMAIGALAGCGDSGPGGDEELVVSAAASLAPAFTAYAAAAGIDAKQSFAGSDDLAAQIRAGLVPDVYAGADASLVADLHAEGRLERPVEFATNELVLALPAGAETRIGSIADLGAPGLKLALGDSGVPVGEYAREVLRELPAAEREAILANVGSLEPDVAGIVGKLTQGAVDAGFVYRTDVAAAGGGIEAIELPVPLRPEIRYAAAVVEGAGNRAGARSFIDGLLAGEGAEALAAAGFGAQPR